MNAAGTAESNGGATRKSRTAFLMPAYNSSRADLDRTIASLTSQSEPADVIIVDDGSRTPIRDLVPEQTGVEVIRLPRNGGITAALNFGLEHILAQGYTYVARMDCGDICTPDRIARQQAHMDGHPELDLLGSCADIVDEAGNHLFFEGTVGDAAIRRKLFDNPAFKHPTFFFRTDSVRRLGPYSDQYPHAEDYEYLRRFAAKGTIDCLPDILLIYEKNAAGISSRNRFRQLTSRLKIQLRYFVPTSPAAWVGVLRTCVTLMVPARLWAGMSRLYWLARDRRSSVAAE